MGPIVNGRWRPIHVCLLVTSHWGEMLGCVLHNWPYSKWSVATDPCSLHLRSKLSWINEWICSERRITLCTLVKAWLFQGFRFWPQFDVTGRRGPMRALASFILQRKQRCNMRRTRLLWYSPQPACSGWPAGFISTCFTHLRYHHIPLQSCGLRRCHWHSLSLTTTPVRVPSGPCVKDAIGLGWGGDFLIVTSLDDQTQADSKPDGQPKQASLNQCQLIAANSPNWCSTHPQLIVAIRFLCNVIDTRALIVPTRPRAPGLLAWVLLFTIGRIVIGLSPHIHSFLHPRYIWKHEWRG